MQPSTLRKIGGVVIASTVLFGTFACEAPQQSASSPSPTPQSTMSPSPQGKLTAQSKIAIDGIGPIRVGMSVAQASSAAGTQLVPLGGKPALGSSCYYVKPQGGPTGVELMVIEGRIARVDVTKNSRSATLSGAKVGDTEAQIKALYPKQIQVSPHKYLPNGHYLTFVPQDTKDSNYRLVFETDGDRVTGFRSGKLPEVEWVERCG